MQWIKEKECADFGASYTLLVVAKKNKRREGGDLRRDLSRWV